MCYLEIYLQQLPDTCCRWAKGDTDVFIATPPKQKQKRKREKKKALLEVLLQGPRQ